MSVRIEPFRLTDLEPLRARPLYLDVADEILSRPLIMQRLMTGPYSWTAWNEYGLPVAACGILENGVAWAFVTEDARRDILAITRAVRQVLDLHVADRGQVTAEVRGYDEKAVKWASLLGFVPVGGGNWVYA